MDKWNKINATEQIDNTNGNGQMDKNFNADSILDSVLNYIKKTYKQYLDKPLKFYDISVNDIYFYYDKHKHVLMRIDNKYFAKKANQCKIINKRRYKLAVQDYEQQGLIDMCISLKQTLLTTVNTVKHIGIGLQSLDFKLLVADTVALMMDLSEGHLSVNRFITTVIKCISLSARYHKVFVPQGLEASTNDMFLVLSYLGIPDRIMKGLRDFTALTGKRITDCDLLMDLASRLFGLLVEMFNYLIQHYGWLAWLTPMVTILNKMFNFFRSHNLIKEILTIYSAFVKDTHVMFDPVYRTKAMEVYEKTLGNVAFMAFLKNGNNRHFQVTYDAFVENVIKMVKTYGSSSREEPICFVFEGAPGSGKSVVMNAFVEILKKQNRSIYVHTVPPVDAGKDFYDDYNNQDVFVMDDVGQQGISQWRTIINFVSPVVYPLECASVTNKNTKFFNSKIILCTTNALSNLHGLTKSDCISDIEALFRRIHVIECRRDASATPNLLSYQYKKFDYLLSHKWKHEFLAPNESLNKTLNPDMQTNNLYEGLVWLGKMLKGIEKNEKLNRSKTEMSELTINEILTKIDDDTYVPQGLLDDAAQRVKNMWSDFFNGTAVFYEWIRYISNTVVSEMTTGALNFVNDFLNNLNDTSVIAKGAIISILSTSICAFLYFIISKFNPHETTLLSLMKNVTTETRDFIAQGNPSINGELPEVVNSMYRFSRIIVRRSDNYMQHAIVSGGKIMVPAHASYENEVVDFYQSWEHYNNKHKELEAVKLELEQEFISCDIAIYKFEQTLPLYKRCDFLFRETTSRNPVSYIISADKTAVVIRGLNVRLNDQEIVYGTKVQYRHAVESGYYHPISEAGFCGSFLCDDTGSIFAMHVAGNGEMGFMVSPSTNVQKQIRELMLKTMECEFEIDKKVLPGMSGARLRYDAGEIAKVYPIGKTQLRPSELHADYNEHTQKLLQELSLHEDIRIKGPPIIEKPIAKLEEMSKKTFQHLGDITNDELLFIEQYIDTFIVPFDDLSDTETVFGNDKLPSLNKQSSNGYGCLKNKTEYFDYEKRELKPAAIEYLSNFENAVRNDETHIADTLCVETFKDELRIDEKRETPRTFRVMPLAHLFYSKKLMGRLMEHFVKNHNELGLGIGFNPYKDMDALAHKLRDCDVTCDADFSKWDGTLHVAIMRIIHNCLRKKYKGSNIKMLDYLLMTTYNSTVLVYDAIYRTTHGLPSGTWLTLALNCLYNKGINGLVIKRNGGTLKDLENIVDNVTGDDKIFGASGRLASVFNAETVRDVAESLGMKCTNGDKTPITKPHQPFDKLTYLKRKFLYNNHLNRYVGALSLETIVNTLQWLDKTKDPKIVMEGKVLSMQIESFLHGDYIYNLYVKYIHKVLPEARLFSVYKIIDILESDDGYLRVTQMSGKDINWMI